MEWVYGFGVLPESQLREAGEAKDSWDENNCGEGVMLKRLHLRSGGLTEIRDSPVDGLTWRQYKAARKFMKRHMRVERVHRGTVNGVGLRFRHCIAKVFHSLNELLQNKNRVYLCGVFELPRKHRWG